MSAPDTNIEKQERQHKPSLWGIKLAAAAGVLMLIAIVGGAFSNAEGPDAEPAAAATY